MIRGIEPWPQRPVLGSFKSPQTEEMEITGGDPNSRRQKILCLKCPDIMPCVPHYVVLHFTLCVTL